MSLREQWVPIRFQLGVETEQDPKTLIPGQLTSLENAVFNRRTTITKRYGTERLQRTRVGAVYSALSGVLGLASRDDRADLVALASTDEVLSFADDEDGWVDRGDWVHVRSRISPLPRRPYESWDATTASTGSVRVVAWEDARGGVYAQLLSDHGVAYGPDFRIGGGLGRNPRALAIGGQLHVYFTSGTVPASLHVGVINPSDPTTANATTVQLHSSLWSQNPTYGVAPIGTAANASLIAASQSGSIYLAVVRPNGQIGTPTTTPAYPNPISGSIGTEIAPEVIVTDDGGRAAILYKPFNTTSGTLAWCLTMASLSTIAFKFGNPDIIRMVDVPMDTDASVLGYGAVRRITGGFISSAGTSPFIATYEVSASDAANRYLRISSGSCVQDVTFDPFISGTLIRHSSLGSQQFTMGGRPFVWATHVSPLQGTDFLVRVDDGLVAGRSRPGQALTDVSGVLGSVEVVGDIAYRAVNNREQLALPNAPISASAFADRDIKLHSLEYQPEYTWKPVDVDGVLHMPGGWLGIYDGNATSEHGFALMSEAGNLSPYGSAGNIGQGSFLWAAVPEAYDARGNRYLGGFVQFLTASFTGSNNSGTLDLRTIAHTMRDGVRGPDLRFGIYRSGPNGTVLQRVGTVTNQTGSDTVRFVDNVSEAQRSLGEVIYASAGGGGEKMNSMPLAPSTLALAGDRLYLSGLEGDPYTIAVSKLRVGGAVAFADGDELSVEAVGGPITALCAIDDRIAAFKRSRVYAATSDGPGNDFDDNTPWPLPQRVTADVGAQEPATVVEVAGTTLQGLAFWSERGARQLTRDLQVQDIGGPIRGYDDLTVVGAIAPSAHDEVRFYTAEGRTLVLNTRFDQWSTFPSQPAVGAADWDNRPTYAWSDGSVWAENTGSFVDGGTPYPMRVELGWLPLQGIQGMSRVRSLEIIGEYYSPHTLRVEMAFDYRDSWRKVREIDVTASLGVVAYGGGVSGSSAIGYGSGSYGGSDPVYQFRIDPPIQRVESMRLRLSDVDATGRSFDLTELKLRIATESEKARVPTRKVR